jgi:hypothetical protein
VLVEIFCCFSGRKMDLTLTLHTSSPCNLVWADISGKSLGTLEAAASKELSLTAVPLATGLHVSKIKLLSMEIGWGWSLLSEKGCHNKFIAYYHFKTGQRNRLQMQFAKC